MVAALRGLLPCLEPPVDSLEAHGAKNTARPMTHEHDTLTLEPYISL